jgi:hypothetical protein
MRTFWHAHIDCWKRSDLNQGEYCQSHGLLLKNFGIRGELGVQKYRRHAH